MGMSVQDWGTVLQIGGKVLKIGGRIGGGIAAKRAERRMRHRNDAKINEMRQREQTNYEEQMNADALQSAYNQRLMTYVGDQLKSNRAAISGQRGVGMATGEDMATQKAADNQVIAQTASQISANEGEKRDLLRQQHLAMQDSYDQQNIQGNKDHFNFRMQSIKGTVQQTDAAGNEMSKVGDSMGGKASFLNNKS